jgi:hypothetical protein
MPRLVYLSGVGLALVALAFAVTDAALGPRPGVTEANVRRIKPGMLKGEVEAILGGPGQWMGMDGKTSWKWDYYDWSGPAGRVRVTFGGPHYPWDSGKEGGHFLGSRRPGFVRRPGGVEDVYLWRTAWPNPLDRLRDWLGW